MINIKSKPKFYSYQEASRFFKRDFRTLKKLEGDLFEIDKNLPNPNITFINCFICKKPSPKTEARSGYCKTCSKKGLSRKEQGKKISKLYKGVNNPNFLHGLSKVNEYQTRQWRDLKQSLNFTKCKISNIETNIDYHHIIPRWFCKLSNIDIYDPLNIIGLNQNYHKAIHHLQLDILLLPNLYSLYKKDARQLRKQFLHLCKLHKVHELPLELLEELCLFDVSRYPGKKKLCDLLPEFLQPFLNQLE